jgi:photosynthetic reaction center H subunit
MPTGAITGEIDVAQVVLYVFWAFFAGLIFYLRREDKREGYPLESDRTRRASRVAVEGFPAVPQPKTFMLDNGETVQKPDGKADTRPVKAEPAQPFEGAPLQPTGNPMTDGVGPAAYAEREEEPERLFKSSEVKIEPLSKATAFSIMEGDPDPRGMQVVGCDDKVAGTCTDVWVDKPDAMIRYLEVDVGTEQSPRKAMLPFFLSRIVGSNGNRWISAKSVTADQFKQSPQIKSTEQITKREEDMIVAYFGSGHLYAKPERTEPLV